MDTRFEPIIITVKIVKVVLSERIFHRTIVTERSWSVLNIRSNIYQSDYKVKKAMSQASDELLNQKFALPCPKPIQEATQTKQGNTEKNSASPCFGIKE